MALGVLAYQGVRTALALRSAAASAQDLRTQVSDGELQQARSTARSLADDASVARRHSDGWLWSAATLTPVVGDDLAAVRDLAQGLDALAGRTPDALALLDAVKGGLRTPDGAIDLGVVEGLRQPVGRLAAAVDTARADVADVRPDDLVPPLAGPAEEFVDQLDSVASMMGSADSALRLLPTMAGGDGRRDYLLVVQNNAEIRATGGLPGSTSVLTVRDGEVSLGNQGNAGAFGFSVDPVAPLSPAEKQLYGTTLATDLRDTNLTPDFPRTASLMSRIADRVLARPVDGVISIDPVTLAQVLRAIGPVEVAGQQLTADNAVDKLLHQPYQTLPDNDAQDAYFRQVSRGMLDAVLSASGDQVALVQVLSEAVRQRRLLVWSATPAEQEVLARYPVAGALPRDTGTHPAVGFYLNDATAAKIQYFLRYDLDLASLGCTDRGQQVVEATMRLRSRVPRPVSQLTDFVTGYGDYAPRGDDRMNLRMYAPTGGKLTALTRDGKAADIQQVVHDGRQVSVLPVLLAPGQEMVVKATFTTRPGQDGTPRLSWTPGIEWAPTSVVARSRCG
ncbi:DUF4012 domain-containing protein [Nocardioides scoriae]|uniref:DUF4012 domain-containing protein n=1 Tax=Nocardioides scoriae TaxID=642780 RepID=UPI0012F825BE|nr:DUF4012 domain-containing protein [Nocardioides scoriae]